MVLTSTAWSIGFASMARSAGALNLVLQPTAARAPSPGVGALIQRGGRAVAGMLTIATAGGS